MILTSRSASWGPPSSKHISSHIVQGVHILVCNIILSIFCDLTLTSAARNVCQFTYLSHPSQCKAHHSVSFVYERFVLWEGDVWEVCVSDTVFDVVKHWTVWWRMFEWSEKRATTAPCQSQNNCSLSDFKSWNLCVSCMSCIKNAWQWWHGVLLQGM